MSSRPRCSYYSECKVRVYPSDPENGGYLVSSLCDMCYSYKEALFQPIREEPLWGSHQWDKIQQLQSEVVGWRQKHAEMMAELDHLKKPQSKYD